MPKESKNKIRKIAIELLCWYRSTTSTKNGNINHQIQISEFGGLEQFYLVHRRSDSTGCGCCHGFSGPDHGVLGFKPDDDTQEKDSKLEEKMKPRNKFREMVSTSILAEFENIKKRDPTWSIPELKFVDLTRDDVLI